MVTNLNLERRIASEFCCLDESEGAQ
jgi:hypothetical protein